MADMVNPYIAGAPVTEAKMFFGREDVFNWIQNSLTGRYAAKPYGIFRLENIK